MAKLKLGTILAIHRDLVAYGNALGREIGQGAVEPAKLIGPMLARFMATDRAFAKQRRTDSTSQRSHPEKSSSEKPA